MALSDDCIDNVMKDEMKHEYFVNCGRESLKVPKPIPSDNENNRNIILREKVDEKKLEYIINNPEEFELGSRSIHGKKNRKRRTTYPIKELL